MYIKVFKIQNTMIAKALLFGKTYTELQEICNENNLPNYTAIQMLTCPSLMEKQ